MLNNRSDSGFAHIVLFLFLALVIMCGFVFWRISSADRYSVSIDRDKPEGLRALKYESENAHLGFRIAANKNFDQEGVLTTYFPDSVSSEGGCPEKVEGFKGKATIRYESDSKAKVTATQNKPAKKYKKDDKSDGVTVCPDVEVPSFNYKITLDKKWLTKKDELSISLNGGDDYNIHHNRNDSTITWTDRDRETPYEKTFFLAPDQVAFLSSFQDSKYKSCMSKTELANYAHANKISLASHVYPDLENKLTTFDPSIMQADPSSSSGMYYKPSILVMVNDHLRELSTREEKRTIRRASYEECRPHVSGAFNR